MGLIPGEEMDTPAFSEVDDFGTADADCCKTEELTKLFYNCYIEVKKVETGKELTHLLASNSDENFAVVSCDKSVSIIDKETFEILSTYKPHKKDITEIVFSPLNGSVLYSSSLNGNIKLWDARSNSCERVMKFNSEKIKKPLTTFDVSPQDRIICAGTELVGEDSYLLFWDLRGDKLLGGYWESHSDDISRVKFDPSKTHCLASSGADGLLNIFDVSKSSEDDALTYCLNTEDTVNAINWYGDGNKQKILTITDVQSVQLWDIEESAATFKFSREAITKSLMRNVMYECYIIPTNYTNLCKNPIMLAGSGLEHSNRCIRTLKINEKTGSLEPHGILKCDNDQSAIMQNSAYSEKDDSFLTVSEDGSLSIWKKTSNDTSKNTFKIKNVSKQKKLKKWPY